MGFFGLSRPLLKNITPDSDYTDEFIPISNAAALRDIAQCWLKQMEKHISKLESTTRPDVFFESYNFVIDNMKKCTIAGPFTHYKGLDYRDNIHEFQNGREEEAAKFLERYFNTVQARNSSYKSPEARQVVASEFRFSLAPHMEQLTPKLQQQVEEYCQRLLKAE